jgi:uncharacterized protein YgiM (DUF1202 family)
MTINETNPVDLSLEEIKLEIADLSAESTIILKENQERTYSINVKDVKTFNILLKQIEKNTKWTHTDAASLVALWMDLKSRKNEIDAEGNIQMRTATVSSLYQTMLKMTGTGVYEAREHMILLAQIGESISNAMEQVAQDNLQLREIHTRLSLLDDQLPLKTSTTETAEDSVEVEAVVDQAI